MKSYLCAVAIIVRYTFFKSSCISKISCLDCLDFRPDPARSEVWTNFRKFKEPPGAQFGQEMKPLSERKVPFPEAFRDQASPTITPGRVIRGTYRSPEFYPRSCLGLVRMKIGIFFLEMLPRENSDKI